MTTSNRPSLFLLGNCTGEVTLPEAILESLMPHHHQQQQQQHPESSSREKRLYFRRSAEEVERFKASGLKHFPRGDKNRVTCEICGASPVRHRFEGHMNRHKGIEPYTCDHCLETFSCRFNMKTHIQRQHAEGEEKACEICGKMQKSRVAYRSHINSIHKERKYECPICGLKLRSTSQARKHVDMHNQKRDHKCNTCGKAFYDKSVLNIHIRTHTGETPYTCPCSKGFVHRIQYVRHMQKEHPDEPLMKLSRGRAVKQTFRKKEF